MAFFDFLGNGPSQLSLTELLSAVPTIAGDVLQARHGRLGAPIGVGLSDIGQIAAGLGQRQRQQAQNLQMFNALSKIDSRFNEVAPIVQAGGTIQDAIEAFKLKYPQPKGIQNPIELFMQDPAKFKDYETTLASIKPQKPEKQTPFDLWRQQNPNATIADWEKLTHPQTNVNVETPLSPSDLTTLPSGKTGVYMRGKSGGITPTEIPGAKLPTKPTAPEKPTTPAQALRNRNEALTSAAKELASSGLFGTRTPPGDKVLARARDNMAAAGLDITGYPLKDGQKVTLSDGRVVTWRNP